MNEQRADSGWSFGGAGRDTVLNIDRCWAERYRCACLVCACVHAGLYVHNAESRNAESPVCGVRILDHTSPSHTTICQTTPCIFDSSQARVRHRPHTYVPVILYTYYTIPRNSKIHVSCFPPNKRAPREGKFSRARRVY